ncbi:hypothetical protein [Vagococcus fluvialis]|uniref:hypothetical protein n=1 Tax=Vagococcus fluvialis TaxID=2738 RepID=UPI003B5C00B8
MNKIIFLLFKIIFPILLLILLPLIPIFFFDATFTTIGLQMILKSERDYNLAIEMLRYLNLNITYLFSVLIFFLVMNFFKRQNKGKLFNSNSNMYYNFYYPIFWIASNILGYDLVQLAGIPLHMQYKLILRGTFTSIKPDIWVDHYDTKSKLSVISISDIKKRDPKKINFIISDTYKVKNNEIEKEYRKNSVISISSGNSDSRYINDDLVQSVRSAFQLVRKNNFDEIYIFSTANPQNNLNIVNSTFRFFGRFVNFKIFVVQKNNKGKYANKYRII